MTLKDIAVAGELQHQDVWTFEYRKITVEINRFCFRGCDKDKWTYYLYISIDHLPEDRKKGAWLRHRKQMSGWKSCKYTNSWLSDLFWHHGITFYQKRISDFTKGSGKFIQVGCDYVHYWDEGMSYNQETLKHDAMKTVDSLYELFDYSITPPEHKQEDES